MIETLTGFLHQGLSIFIPNLMMVMDSDVAMPCVVMCTGSTAGDPPSEDIVGSPYEKLALVTSIDLY